jgi:putative MATE family efflux protein
MEDLTTGPITRHLMKTTSFMLVTMVFQTLYILVDLYWVGRLGTAAIAAVAISGNLAFVVLALSQMLGVGTTTLVSHAAGRKDRDGAIAIFNQSQLLSVTSGLIFLLVAMGTRHVYAARLAADELTRQATAEYLAWFIPAMALQFTVVALAAALRGTGAFKPGMIVQTATIIINIVLAPFLVFGWGTGVAMGVAGAAVATLIAIAIGAVWMAGYFLRADSYLRFTPGSWTPRLSDWGNLLRIGLPAGAEFALMAVYLFIVYDVIRRFGPSAQAGFGIGLRVIQALFLPVVALGFATAAVAGQNYGARQAHRVRATFADASWMAAGTMTLFVIVAHVAPGAIVRFFSSDPAAVAVGEEYLRIVSWNFIASGLVFVSSSMFQAIGNTVPPLLTSFFRIVMIAVPLYFLAQMPGFIPRWIWYLSVIAVTVQMTLNLLLLRREFGRALAFAAVSPVVPSQSPQAVGNGPTLRPPDR